jgi:hypothetical protein
MDLFPRFREWTTVWIAAIGLAAASAGCNGANWNLPFDLFGSTGPKTTFVTPAQKIEQLKVLAETKGEGTGKTADQVVVQLAEQLKTEADPLVREQIVRTMTAFPTAGSVFVLEAVLTDREERVRIAACEALAGLKYTEAQTALVQTLQKDADVDVRLAAADALGKFPVQQSIDALAAALDDRDPALQFKAMASLREITGQDFGNRVDAWRMYARGETPPPPAPVSIAERLRGWTQF